MSKIETDTFLMSSFSKEYRQVEEQVCKEMNLNDSQCCTEDLQSFNLNEMTEEYVEDPSFLDEIKQLLSTSGLDALFAEREKEAMAKRKSGKVKLNRQSVSLKDFNNFRSSDCEQRSKTVQTDADAKSIRCRFVIWYMAFTGR